MTGPRRLAALPQDDRLQVLQANVNDAEAPARIASACVQAYGIVPERYQAYADRRWGRGWKINPNGRAQAWNELDRYGNDQQGYLDKIESEMQLASRGRTA